MQRTKRIVLVAAAALLGSATSRDASAQGLGMCANVGFTLDAALAKRGRSLFENRGCAACHTIGRGNAAGPDLAGLLDRRSMDWLTRWLQNTSEMLNTDSTAQALLAEFKGVKMPNVKLKEEDIQAVIHYIAQEDAKRKKPEGS